MGANGMSELDMLRMQANKTNDESLESTRRMLQMANQAHDTGAKTLVELNEQGEKLDNINRNLDDINNDMKEAEKNLDDLDKCCGLCILPWNRTKRKNFSKEFKSKQYTYDNSRDGGRIQEINTGGGEQPIKYTGNIQRITNCAKEDEMDANIGQVSHLVGGLKNMAMDMNTELKVQDRKIEDMKGKVDANSERIRAANAQANKHLEKPVNEEPVLPDMPTKATLAKKMIM